MNKVQVAVTNQVPTINSGKSAAIVDQPTDQKSAVSNDKAHKCSADNDKPMTSL